MFGHDKRVLAAVFVGGAIGTVARAALAEFAVHDPARWPWATFVVNIIGAFLLGCISIRLPAAGYGRALLGTGFCGGLTTFSTMQVETLRMLEHQHYGLAFGYTATSVAAGLAAVYLAIALGRR